MSFADLATADALYLDRQVYQEHAKSGDDAAARTSAQRDAIDDLERKLSESRAQLANVALPAAATATDSEMVKRWQAELKALGFYAGSIDGEAGKGTTAANAAFVASRKAPILARRSTSFCR